MSGKCCGYFIILRVKTKSVSFIVSFVSDWFLILLLISILKVNSNPAALPNKGFKRTNEVKSPQVNRLSGFFIVNKSTDEYKIKILNLHIQFFLTVHIKAGNAII